VIDRWIACLTSVWHARGEMKVLSLEDALDRHVDDGASVYITGFTHLIDFATAHELARRRVRDLTLIRMTPDLVYEQLIAAGCASRLVFSYLGNPGIGPLHAIKRTIEAGKLKWTEYTHGSLIAALRAGAQHAPFVAVPAVAGTDLAAHNPHYATVRSPFSGEDVTVVAPLRPDVAIVHVQRADPDGNCQVWGSAGELADVAFASRAVIVTAEEIVDEAAIRADPNRTLLPAWAVDAVVHAPWACHPSFVQGFYARDNAFYREWAELSRDDDRLAAYLDEWVYGVESREEYVQKLGPRAEELATIGDAFSVPVNYGDNATIAAAQR
jgi:glutaconate CoA-transferase subunit A